MGTKTQKMKTTTTIRILQTKLTFNDTTICVIMHCKDICQKKKKKRKKEKTRVKYNSNSMSST